MTQKQVRIGTPREWRSCDDVVRLLHTGQLTRLHRAPYPRPVVDLGRRTTGVHGSRRRRQPSPIAVANEHVSILWVCRLIGMAVPDDVVRSIKLRCPFGTVYHSDHGVAPAMRVYPDENSAHCFAKCGHFSPVSLAATVWDQPRIETATQLLDLMGYRPLSLAQLWAAAITREQPPDTTLLSVALRTYCERLDHEWLGRQYEPRIATALDQCLSLLARVHTEDDAHQWLACGKAVMARVLAVGDGR